MNTRYITGLAITTAAYRCDWTQDTDPTEIQQDFDRIIAQAQQHVYNTGIDYQITEQDVRQALWGEVA
jgi:hypothetical protein